MSLTTDKLKTNLTNGQRTYNWDVLIPNPLGGGDPESFTLRCQTASIPGRSFGRIHVEYKQGPGFNVPGKNRYEQSWNVTVLEGEDKAMHDFFHQWQQNIVNDKSELGFGDAFVKRDIYFKMHSTKGEPTLQIKLIGAYPENKPSVPVAMEGENVVRYSVTFSFDKWVEV